MKEAMKANREGTTELQPAEILKYAYDSTLNGNRNLPRRYPVRPSQRLYSSPAVDALRAVLDEAPTPDLESTLRPDYLRSEQDEEGWVYVYWSEVYLEQLYEALFTLIREQGIEAWRTARYEVYEVVRALHLFVCICGPLTWGTAR